MQEKKDNYFYMNYIAIFICVFAVLFILSLYTEVQLCIQNKWWTKLSEANIVIGITFVYSIIFSSSISCYLMSLINKWDSKLNKIMRRVSNRSQIFIVWLLLILFLQGLTDYILFLFNVRNAAAMSSLVTLFLSITGFFGFRSIQIANLTLNSFELIQNKNNSYKFDFSKNELTFWIINTGNHINNYSFLGIYQLSDNESIDHFENNLETNKLFSSNHWLKIHADKVSLIPLMPNESSKLITIEFTTTLDANQKYLLIFTDSQKRIYDFQLSSLENHCNH